MEHSPAKPGVVASLIAGAAAGSVVDLTLFPLDTLKTRLQSKAGFRQTGGFSGMYKGLIPVLIGSAPTAAVFFVTYNSMLNNLETSHWSPVFAASVAEVAAASFRVPIEIVKQRKQVSIGHTNAFQMVRTVLKQEGVAGMYRGFFSTLCREIPFGCIQYPLWEWIKYKTNAQEAWHIGLSGAVAGGVAAFLTTPMDVIKTRIMLREEIVNTSSQRGISLLHRIAREIIQDRGFLGFFSGVVPRVLWMMTGGFIYFGVYGKTAALWTSYCST